MMAAMMSLKYWLLFREETAIYCEDYAKHMNGLDMQNVVLMLKQTVDIVFTVLLRVKLNDKYPVPWII